MVGKKEVFWINNQNGDFFKDSKESLLTFFNKDIEIFLITKSVIGSNLKLMHSHVRGSLRVQFPLYSYRFRPGLFVLARSGGELR